MYEVEEHCGPKSPTSVAKYSLLFIDIQLPGLLTKISIYTNPNFCKHFVFNYNHPYQ